MFIEAISANMDHCLCISQLLIERADCVTGFKRNTTVIFIESINNNNNNNIEALELYKKAHYILNKCLKLIAGNNNNNNNNETKLLLKNEYTINKLLLHVLISIVYIYYSKHEYMECRHWLDLYDICLQQFYDNISIFSTNKSSSCCGNSNSSGRSMSSSNVPTPVYERNNNNNRSNICDDQVEVVESSAGDTTRILTTTMTSITMTSSGSVSTRHDINSEASTASTFEKPLAACCEEGHQLLYVELVANMNQFKLKLQHKWKQQFNHNFTTI